MANHRIRAATPDDVERIKSIAVAAEMFTADEVSFFDEMLAGFFDGSMEGHRWLVLKETVQYAATRQFYAKIGYDEEARVRQFYGPQDDKVMFWKSLVAD